MDLNWVYVLVAKELLEDGNLGGGVDIHIIQYWYVKINVVYVECICLIEMSIDIWVTK